MIIAAIALLLGVCGFKEIARLLVKLWEGL
jgi:hypothetical protein